ncbi:MAG: patatin-like phospholipase family protein [Pseudonocardia sp.]
MKGVALAGAVAALTDAGHEPKRVSGTLAGGIIGAMVAAGLRGAELGEVARAVKYSKFLDPALLDWVPLLGSNDGIYAGKFALQWLTDMLAVHHVHTFADIRDDDPELLPEQRYKLLVTCADLTHGRLVRLPWDYHLYGLDPAEQSVAEAVRATMSVPLLFRPVILTNPSTGEESTLVDGGIVSNFPLDSFDRNDGQRPRWPTFGVTIIPDAPGGHRQHRRSGPGLPQPPVGPGTCLHGRGQGGRSLRLQPLRRPDRGGVRGRLPEGAELPHSRPSAGRSLHVAHLGALGERTLGQPGRA